MPCNTPPKLHPASQPILRLIITTAPQLLIGPSTITSNHLAQLVFLRELPAQNLEVADEGFAAVDQCFFRGYLAVGLDSEFEGCEEGVGD